MRLPDLMADGADASAARSTFDSLVTDAAERERVMRSIGCVCSQLQCHAFQAYNPMVQRTSALYDVLRHGAVQPLNGEEIHAPVRAEGEKYGSKLIQIAVDSDDVLDEVGRELYF